jgi:hypothetical protein
MFSFLCYFPVFVGNNMTIIIGVLFGHMKYWQFYQPTLCGYLVFLCRLLPCGIEPLKFCLDLAITRLQLMCGQWDVYLLRWWTRSHCSQGIRRLMNYSKFSGVTASQPLLAFLKCLLDTLHLFGKQYYSYFLHPFSILFI